jgi:hypothetical protein
MLQSTKLVSLKTIEHVHTGIFKIGECEFLCGTTIIPVEKNKQNPYSTVEHIERMN